MDEKRRNRAADDGSMTVRGWARSRGIPGSTAHKACETGRLTRREDGRLDPDLADREWCATSRLGQLPTPPPHEPETDEDRQLNDVLRDLRDHGLDWDGDPKDDTVSIRVARCWNVVREVAHYYHRERMIAALAPVLADERDAARVAVVLARALDQLADYAEKAALRWSETGKPGFDIRI